MNSVRDRRIMWTIKLILGGCLLAGLLFSNIPGVEGKGWPERCIGYPISALLIPIVWRLRGRRSNYPYLADGLLVSPFVLDLLGNLVNLFDTVDAFDDALHFVNWTLLVAALVLLLDGQQLQRWNVILLGIGFGATAIVAWEAVEWVIQEMGTTGLELTYDDTIGDLVLSTAGGAVGATVASRTVSKISKKHPL